MNSSNGLTSMFPEFGIYSFFTVSYSGTFIFEGIEIVPISYGSLFLLFSFDLNLLVDFYSLYLLGFSLSNFIIFLSSFCLVKDLLGLLSFD